MNDIPPLRARLFEWYVPASPWTHLQWDSEEADVGYLDSDEWKQAWAEANNEQPWQHRADDPIWNRAEWEWFKGDWFDLEEAIEIDGVYLITDAKEGYYGERLPACR